MTIILKGGYWENTPEGRTWKGPGSVIRRGAEDYHWLELENEQACHHSVFYGTTAKRLGFSK